MRARFFLMVLLVAAVYPPRSRSSPKMPQDRTGDAQGTNAAAGSVSSAAKLKPDSGSIVENLYTNDFFGFTFEFPKGWSDQGQAARNYLTEMDEATISGADPTIKAMLEVAAKRKTILLSVFEHPVGSPVQFNSGIVVIAEDASFVPGMKNGSDYILRMKAAIKASQADWKILREPTDITFGGIIFSRMDLQHEDSPGIAIYQSFVSTILKGDALAFVFTSTKLARLETMIDTLNTLRFRDANDSAASAQSMTFQSSPGVMLLTPTQGVDFTAYVGGATMAIKRKWSFIIPDAAKQGVKGKVILEFEIKQDGTILNGPDVKLSSGTSLLDEAALEAVRLSAPFAPLPNEFKGPSIRLRMIFLYNLPLDFLQK